MGKMCTIQIVVSINNLFIEIYLNYRDNIKIIDEDKMLSSELR